MRRIRGKDTAPELAVRKLCRNIGFSGYRLHRKELPGKPDIVWIGRKHAIFVHGCFWHGHDCSEGIRRPKSNRDYWIPKIKRNKQRDVNNIAALRSIGWKVLVVWECEIKKQEHLSIKIKRFLSAKTPNKALNRTRLKRHSG